MTGMCHDEIIGTLDNADSLQESSTLSERANDLDTLKTVSTPSLLKPPDLLGVESRRSKRSRNNMQMDAEAHEKESRSTNTAETEVSKKKKSTPRSAKVASDYFTWICTECTEAECVADPSSDLLICEGKCNRPFHYPCAGLPQIPSSNEKWICSDCKNCNHQCALCQEYGADDQDVYLCDKNGCGLYFHESCLSMQNVEVHLMDRVLPPNGDAESDLPTIISTPRFTCPAHSCWTCTEDYIPAPDDDDAPPSGKKQRGKTRKKGRPIINSNFAPKPDPRLFRCLHCPIAYHISCIPPMARFHELALLCHEHAASCKLPDLDLESSLQSKVEAEVDRKVAKLLKETKPKRENNSLQGSPVENPFFLGVQGDDIPANELKLLSLLRESRPDHEYLSQGLTFCLPCDIQEEVHSKPPSYRHVHALQYNPSSRPKRLPPSDECCECHIKGIAQCDETCLNRMVMMECVGDRTKSNGEKNPYWNCNVGPSCGNRQISQRATAKCQPKREKGKGWGLVSINGVPKGNLVQEYVGEVMNEHDKAERLNAWARDHPNDPNFYVMQLDTGWYIDARQVANLSRFVNHSCDPNCRLTRVNVGGYMRIGIFSLRDIAPGEFFSYDYQFDTRFGDKFLCRCGALKCRGTMKGGKGALAEDGTEQLTKKEEWTLAKVQFDRDKKFLEDVQMKKQAQSSQVDVLVPAGTQTTETVASGPQERYRDVAQRNRIFLWRNVVQGADFLMRWSSATSTVVATTPSYAIRALQPTDVISMLR